MIRGVIVQKVSKRVKVLLVIKGFIGVRVYKVDKVILFKLFALCHKVALRECMFKGS